MRFLFRLACFFAALWTGSAPSADSLAIVLSDRAPPYTAASEAIRAQLAPGTGVVEVSLEAGGGLRAPAARLIAAVGSRACAKAAEAHATTPILCVLVPRNAFDRVAAKAAKDRAMSAIVLDQPLERQLALVRIALPDAREVGVLLGPESMSVERALVSAAYARGLRVGSARIERQEDLYPALQSVLSTGDVLLAIPDAEVFSSGTAQNIIRTAFHRRVPIVGFSPAYVQAGATLALYATPEQIGRLAGKWVNRFLEGGPLPRPQAPPEFKVAMNERVARALGLELPAEADIEKQLRAAEPAR